MILKLLISRSLKLYITTIKFICKVVSEINLHPLKILNCNASSFEKFCKQNYTYF